MGKPSSTKRLSSISQSTSESVDIKARKRIEHLYELTDEIINAYNEINEKYVHQIYRKYRQLKETNKNLKESLNHHHCAGCKCVIKSNGNEEEEEEEEEEEDGESSEENDEQTKNSALPSSTTNSIITRSKKKNPFIISDIEETQNFNGNDSRFNQNASDDDEDRTSMDTDQPPHKTESSEESDEEEEEEVDADNGMARLPLALRIVIQNKAKRKKNAKAYLLEIPRYPALCEYLRDKSQSSFDHRPSETQVRPLIANHISKNLANDAKIRMRLRDELREIHRSYMRTFMTDPHTTGPKLTIQKTKLPMKKSPM